MNMNVCEVYVILSRLEIFKTPEMLCCIERLHGKVVQIGLEYNMMIIVQQNFGVNRSCIDEKFVNTPSLNLQKAYDDVPLSQ